MLSELIKKLDSDINVDRIESEWRSYALEDLSTCLNKATENGTTDCVKYWAQVLQLKRSGGDAKFPYLKSIITVCVSLAHGNADTERSFSETGKILTKHQNSTSCELINGLMSIKTCISVNGSAATFLITSDAVLQCKQAKARHQERVDAAARNERASRKRRNCKG